MILERSAEGLTARLAPRGAGRFAGAGFLAVWLAFWAVGEAFAIAFLARGAWWLLTGRPIGTGGGGPGWGSALALGAFLSVWLAFWTLGGVLAGRELLRLLWSEHRLIAGPRGLERRERIGPFVSRRLIPRGTPLRLYLLERPGALMADAAGERIELTRLGSPAEREELRRALATELVLPEEPAEADEPAELPRGWELRIDPEGGRVLVRDLDARRKQAVTMAVLTALAGAGTTALAIASRTDDGALVPAAMAAALTTGFAWLQFRLARTHLEWRLESGRLALRRRGPAGATELFAAGSLEIAESRDDDGDAWYELVALAPGAAAEGAAVTRPRSRRERRTVLREIHDPGAVRALGAWLARETQLPLADRTTREARSRDLAALKQQLAASGRFGAWVARQLEGRG
ncbi:MAG: hypothetical protein MUF27_10520 [Acidobacteria bacterium]|nr:hypothetical protein [Acidobacteriota bacterium]